MSFLECRGIYAMFRLSSRLAFTHSFTMSLWIDSCHDSDDSVDDDDAEDDDDDDKFKYVSDNQPE